MSHAGNLASGAPSLDALLLRYPRCLWRGENAAAPGGIPVGLPALEEILPGGVWPAGALIEVVCRGAGEGGLQLFLPAMRHFVRQDKRVVWVRPPHLPYAPSLVSEGLSTERNLIIRSATEEQGLWALEQLLRSPECGVVLSWPGIWSARISRRLRLAVTQGGGLGIVFLREERSLPFSFATLRLALRPRKNGLGVRLLKAAAGQGREAVLSDL
jgi:hypothetical protein